LPSAEPRTLLLCRVYGCCDCGEIFLEISSGKKNIGFIIFLFDGEVNKRRSEPKNRDRQNKTNKNMSTTTTTLKMTYNNELRRVPTQEFLTFDGLKNYAKQLFPVLNGMNELQFAWIDDENDCVLISSDLELEEAYRTMRAGGKGYLRFDIRPMVQSAPTTSSNGNQIHVGVTCDECAQSPIIGIRYKCSVRSDYDICQSCENKSTQPFPMIKFYEPKVAAQMPIIVAINPSERTLKRCEKAKFKEWKEKKHRGVRCNECGVRPITGIRYKCTHRDDFDLCSECEAKKVIQPWPMVKIYSPDQCPEGLQVFSSAAAQNKNPNDITIECDIDMAKGMKILQHLFPAAAAPWGGGSWTSHDSSAESNQSGQSGDVPIHRFIRCNECGMKPIVGFRYKCTIRPEFDLCSACEAKAPQPFPMVKLYNSEHQPQSRGFWGRGGRCGRGGGSWHGRCGGRWRSAEAAADRAREHIEAVARERAEHSEKEARELEEDLISATLEQAISENSHSSFEESKSGSESIPEAYACHPSSPPLATVLLPPKPVISKPMARYVRDVTMPDGTAVQPSSTFVKTWRIRNDGPQSWPEGCFLVNAGGDTLFSNDELRVPVASVNPGEEVDLSATLTAPDASGRHVGYFRLQDAEGNWFGQRLWSDIRVNEVEDNLWHVVGEEANDKEATSAPIPPAPPSDADIWMKELEILAAMGFVDHEMLIPLLQTYLTNPAVDSPNPQGMQALILHILNM
jgi:hypothetical protein